MKVFLVIDRQKDLTEGRAYSLVTGDALRESLEALGAPPSWEPATINGFANRYQDLRVEAPKDILVVPFDVNAGADTLESRDSVLVDLEAAEDGYLEAIQNFRQADVVVRETGSTLKAAIAKADAFDILVPTPFRPGDES